MTAVEAFNAIGDVLASDALGEGMANARVMAILESLAAASRASGWTAGAAAMRKVAADFVRMLTFGLGDGVERLPLPPIPPAQGKEGA